jgi:hypothetical protein
LSKFRSIQNSLIAGEITPTAMGRTDVPQYQHACKILRNAIPLLSGGAYRRPGTLWDKTINGATDFAPGIMTFKVSETEAYCVLMGQIMGGAVYTRIFKPYSNSLVSSEATVTGALPYVGRTTVDQALWGYYDEFHDVQTVQSADVMYCVHPRYKPYKITRTSASNFTIAAFDSGLSGATLMNAYPYFYQGQTSAGTMAISNAAVGAGRTLTSSVAFFETGHIGAIIKTNVAGTVGACKITAVALGGLTATVDVIVAMGGTGAVSTWWESAWSDHRGWPRSVLFHERRLSYGGNSYSPDSTWWSQVDNYGTLSVSTDTDPRTPALAASPFTYTIVSQELNLIQWMVSGKTVVLGTQGGEWVLDEIDPTTGWAAGNISATEQSAFGSSRIQPVRKGSELIFLNKAGDELKALVFNDVEKSYVDEPLQTLYDEFPKAEPAGTVLQSRKIRKMAWDSSRKTLWCVDTAGNLVGMTRDKTLGVTTWHSHQLGGFDADDTGSPGGIDVGGGVYTDDPAYVVCAGSVISLTVVPNPLTGVDDLWLVVKRTIGNATKYHLERMIGKNFPYDTSYQLVTVGPGVIMTDASVIDVNFFSFPTVVAGVFSGLDHIEGESPVGTAYNTKGIFKLSGSAISSGDTTITTLPSNSANETTMFIMGLGFSTIIQPVRIEAGSQIGTSQAALKRIHELTLRMYRTLSCKIGPDADTLETLIFRDGTTPMGQSPELFTGDFNRKFDGTYDRDQYIYILQDQPLPFALAAIIAEGMTYDG